MSKYGSCVTFSEACAMDKERIKRALQGELIFGETDTGFVYRSETKEDCTDFVVSTYDNLVYEAIKSNAVANVLNQILEKNNIKVPIDEFASLLNDEIKNCTKGYIYEE